MPIGATFRPCRKKNLKIAQITEIQAYVLHACCHQQMDLIPPKVAGKVQALRTKLSIVINKEHAILVPSKRFRIQRTVLSGKNLKIAP